MAVYRQVYDSRQLQADCQELYARYSTIGYTFNTVHPFPFSRITAYKTTNITLTGNKETERQQLYLFYNSC